MSILTSRALREADPASAVARGHRRDAQWVALAGSCCRHGLYSVVPSIYSSASPWVGSQPCGAKYPGFCADSKGV